MNPTSAQEITDQSAPSLRRRYRSLRDEIVHRRFIQAKYRFSLGKRVLRPFLSKVGSQRIFRALHRLALAGMGFGDAGVVLYSGEISAFEHVMKTLAARCAPNEPVIVFDVGANDGEYSLMAGPRLHHAFPAGQIHAFEPSESTFKRLTLNVRRLDLICLHQFAFGEKSGVCTLYQVFEGSGLASLYDREKGSLGQYGLKTTLTEEVEVTTIDAFCSENGINRIHLLKIDVEGHESKVLAGAQSMLAHRQPHGNVIAAAVAR
jgi:FkbM family methyltransferase